MAEASLSFITSKIDKVFLECGICSEPFKDPRGLPCLHAFCYECLVDWSKARSEDKSIVSCPLCKKVYQIPEGGVKELPVHQLLTNVKEAVDEVERKTISVTQYCETHDGEIKRYFCENCGVTICSDCCAIDPDHKGHKFFRLKEAANERATSLKELMKKSKEVEVQFTRVLEQTEQIEQNLEGAANAAKEAVDHVRDNVVQQVDNLVKHHKQNIQQEINERTGKISQIMESLNFHLSNVRNINEQGTSVVESGSEYEIISRYPPMLELLQQAITLQPVAANCALSYIKFEPIEVGITSIGKLLCEEVQVADVNIGNQATFEKRSPSMSTTYVSSHTTPATVQCNSKSMQCNSKSMKKTPAIHESLPLYKEPVATEKESSTPRSIIQSDMDYQVPFDKSGNSSHSLATLSMVGSSTACTGQLNSVNMIKTSALPESGLTASMFRKPVVTKTKSSTVEKVVRSDMDNPWDNEATVEKKGQFTPTTPKVKSATVQCNSKSMTHISAVSESIPIPVVNSRQSLVTEKKSSSSRADMDDQLPCHSLPNWPMTRSSTEQYNSPSVIKASVLSESVPIASMFGQTVVNKKKVSSGKKVTRYDKDNQEPIEKSKPESVLVATIYSRPIATKTEASSAGETVEKQWSEIGKIKTTSNTRHARGIAISPNGDIAVTTSKAPATVFSRNGDVELVFKGSISDADDIAITPSNQYIIPGPKGFQRYDGQGNHLSTIPTYDINDQPSDPCSVAVDSSGRIILGLGRNEHKTVSIHHPDGTFISKFETAKSPWKLACAPNDELIISFNDDTVRIMDQFGHKARVIQPPPGIESWEPAYVCCSKRGELFVGNQGNPYGVYRYVSDGTEFRYHDCVTNMTQSPWGVALSSNDGELFVVHHSDN